MFFEDSGLRIVVIVIVLGLIALAGTDVVNRVRDHRLKVSARRRSDELQSRPALKPTSLSDRPPPVEGPSPRQGV